MRYVTTSGDKSIAELAARIYGVEERSAVARKAVKALRDANPELEHIAELPRGTIVEVPEEVLGKEPRRALGDLTDSVGATAVRSLRAGLDSFAEALEEIADERLAEARAERKLLASASVKAAGGEEPALERERKALADENEAEIEEARASKKEQKRALEALADELDELLKVMAAPPNNGLVG
jgi:hypothetical protein